jgi:hypothetical protein
MAIDPDKYVRATAIISHAAIKMSLEKAYPELSMTEHDHMFLAIIDRMARFRNYTLRYQPLLPEEEDID